MFSLFLIDETLSYLYGNMVLIENIVKTYFFNFSIFLFLTVLFACKKDVAPASLGNYPTEIGRIMTYKCASAGCHNDASYNGAANLNLSTYNNLFKGSINGSPVVPYSSEFSSLCFFINTYDDLGSKNAPTMPINGSPLSREEVITIKNWIDNGAPDIDGNVMWADDLNRKKYYVLNQGCDVVTVFDAASQLPIRYIKVGSNPNNVESPHMIKVSPDGAYWYVIFVAGNMMQKYKTSDDSFVGQAYLGAYVNWNTIAISNNGKRGYCVSWQAASRLAVVDLDNMITLHNIGGGNFTDAHGIALNHTNDTLYVTRQTGNYIYKMDTAINNIDEITIDGSNIPNQTSSIDPHEVMFSPDGSKYFVTCQATNEVRVLSTVGNHLLQTINTGMYPQEMAKSSVTNKLYVTCTNDPNPNPKTLGSVTVMDMSTYQTNNYKVGYQPHGIAIDETNGYVIVASRNYMISGPTPHHSGICGRNGFVNYFKLNSMELLNKKTEVASDPYSVAVKP